MPKARPVFLGLLLTMLATLLTPPGWAAAPAVKDWTWLVFINADNNLDGYGVDDQEEMARIGSNDQVNIVTLIDRKPGPATLNFIDRGEVRPLRELGEVDMGDWRQLVAFFREAATRYPARHYALVLWNHGSGWRRDDGQPRGISYDDSSGHHIGTHELGLALGEIAGFLGRRLDLLGMDACLMQMLEVAWEVRAGCDFIVASEETEPVDGWPYAMILKGLRPGMAPRDLAAHVVKSYEIFFATLPEDDDPDRPRRARETTQSALDTSRLPALRDALDRLATAAPVEALGPAVTAAAARATRFTYASHMDLGHFLRLLAREAPASALAAAARAAEAALAAAVVANATTGGEEADGSRRAHPATGPATHPAPTSQPHRGLEAYGLAIHHPPAATGFVAEYRALAFARESRWIDLVQAGHQAEAVNEVLPALRAGDAGPLARFAAAAGPGNREVCRQLLREANRVLFIETPRPSVDSRLYQTLVAEMLARTRRQATPPPTLAPAPSTPGGPPP